MQIIAAILQREVPVLAGDTAETLAARVLEEEHRAYVDAVAAIVKVPERDAFNSVGCNPTVTDKQKACP